MWGWALNFNKLFRGNKSRLSGLKWYWTTKWWEMTPVRTLPFRANPRAPCHFEPLSPHLVISSLRSIPRRIKYNGEKTAVKPFNVFPNPVQDKLYINIESGNDSKVVIRLFDSKSALVKLQNGTLLKGNNQIGVDVKNLLSGVYHLSVSWNIGQVQKTSRVVKR